MQRNLPIRRWALLFFLCLGSLAAEAQRSVSGRILSGDDQSPLPGVNILLKGTTNGTISDADGRFTLSGVSDNDVLVFSYVGYITQETTVASRTAIDVALLPDAKQLSEVVVTALGIEKEASKIGYITQKVQGSDLIKAREPNPLNSLVGKVAGLTVGASSELLGKPQLVLRGETDLIIVVDGVPVNSDTWNVSPDDIETYTVLKGPNAAALYGSRGRNGAILITTKRGAKDKRGFQVDFNSSTMVDKSFLTIPKVQDEYGPGEYNTYKFGDDVFGQVNGYNQNDYDVWGPKFNGQLISQYDSPVDPATGKRQGTPWIARGKNNLQRFVQAGILATNNIAVSSSNEKYDLRASFSQSYQRGIVPTTQLNISNFNITSGYNLSSKIRFETAINYNRQYTPNVPDVNYGPNSMIYNIDIWGGSDWDINDLKNYWQPGKVGVQQRSYEYYRYNNPWFLAKEWTRGHYKNDVYGYLTLKYAITDWMKLAVRSQITTWDVFRNEKFPYSATVYGREQKQGDYREDKRRLFENNTDVMLTINKDIAKDFNINGLIGGNLRTYSFGESYATTDYLNVPGVYNFSNSKNPVRVYNYDAAMQVGSAYYSFDFSYKNYLTISTTGRYDKYSTFYKGYNAGFYPSVSASTVLNDYLGLPDAISFLKLRGSYANVKNAFTASSIGPAWQAIGAGNPIDYGSTYSSAYDGPLYNSNTYNVTRVYNNGSAAYYTGVLSSPTLKPSASSSMEGGFDIKFLENRLGLDLTIFKAEQGPGIVTQQFSEASGFSGGTINGVKTEKKGIEIALSGTPLKSTNGLTWNIQSNWSTYKQTYKEFYNGLTTLNGGYLGQDSRIDWKVGDRIDNLYGYRFFRSPDGQIIHDASGMALRDNRKAQLLGHTNPDYVWSLINTFTYKNFSFNFQFDGRVGGVGVDYIYKKLLQGGREMETVQGEYGKARLAEFNANPNNDPTLITPTYTGNGVVVASGTPIVDAQGHITNYNELTFAPNTTAQSLQDYVNRETSFDERVLISKSFAKLRQVTLTYNVPSSVLQRTFIRQASISLVGRNLLYFAKRTDIDLDQFIGTNTGSQILQSPTLRRFGVNLNLTF
ncbi:MAG: SusC/RagA family TonB-linked outer membrane protein [Cyclobacteriaceae bacterium]|nr:SusC/RagA family TonB-linked outer membrane protein [Cyclobacteriaceae bacterium]